MNCPHCNHHPLEPTGAHDWFCPMCLFAGSSDVLEALAERLAPAGILAEAERLLREREVHMVALRQNGDGTGGVTLWGLDGRKIRSRGTLVEAVARLEKERGKGGDNG